MIKAGKLALLSTLAVISLIACDRNHIRPEAFQPEAEDLSRTGRKASAESCRIREALRNAYFGDLHVHTGLSSDAWNYDVRIGPREAYAYAFGRPIRLPPNDEKGRGKRIAQIDRPLDFAAVTDHAEFLGERILCEDRDSPAFESETCARIRAAKTPLDSPLTFKIAWPWPSHDEDVCGENGLRCERASLSAWNEIIDAAEEWNDESDACERTTFIAFEYSSLRLGSNLHRNVIFRNHVTLSRPISYMEVQREWELWRLLEAACIHSGRGCDALSIPHNSNISNGRMFSIDYPSTATLEEEIQRARLRARMEPVAEIMQHKGDSECRIQMAGILGEADEFCAFEKFENFRHLDADGRAEEPSICWDFMADSIPKLGPGACINHRNYLRYVLTEGLAEEKRLGINPFKLGLMASTDTHNGMAGGVTERDWPGHLGVADAELASRLIEESGGMGNLSSNPGGLVGVWAPENSREAIFLAIRKREVFGTSGPRIQPRFFGGWGYPEELCASPERVAEADRGGIPMGGDLPPPPASGVPVFAAFALADPGIATAPGADLDRIQIIKGWVDDEGGLHQRVFDVVGGDHDASVDPNTCEQHGHGARQLCSVWRDPEFDPNRRAVYYARVLEVPSCRYSALDCASLPPEERPSGCAHNIMQQVQQERAWTSPIWYTPDEQKRPGEERRS